MDSGFLFLFFKPQTRERKPVTGCLVRRLSSWKNCWPCGTLSLWLEMQAQERVRYSKLPVSVQPWKEQFWVGGQVYFQFYLKVLFSEVRHNFALESETNTILWSIDTIFLYPGERERGTNRKSKLRWRLDFPHEIFSMPFMHLEICHPILCLF